MIRSNVLSGKSSLFAFITWNSHFTPWSSAFSVATSIISLVTSIPTTSWPILVRLMVKNPGPVPMSRIFSTSFSGALSRISLIQRSLVSLFLSSFLTPSLYPLADSPQNFKVSFPASFAISTTILVLIYVSEFVHHRLPQYDHRNAFVVYHLAVDAIDLLDVLLGDHLFRRTYLVDDTGRGHHDHLMGIFR